MKEIPFYVRFRYLWYVILLLPVFIFRDYTPANELKYISIAFESLQNNTWFTFYNHGEIYADKPPLFLWLIKISIYLTGSFPMWITGLFSLFPAIGVIAIMDKWVKQANIIINPFIASLMLLTSVMFLASTLVVRMDLLMVFFIILSLYTFYRIYKNKNKPVEKYLLSVYIFLALFSKGPIGLLAPIGSIITFLVVKGEIRTLGRYLGWRQWLILLGLCFLWFLGVYLEGGTPYLHDLVFRQTIGRGINSFHHKGPIWYYIPRMLWSFAPWSILLITLFVKGFIKRYLRTDLQKFFLVIIAFNLIMLSLISSKLDIYLLPIYPFVIYLACILLETKFMDSKIIRISLYVPAILLALLSATALLFGDKLVYHFAKTFPIMGWLPYIAVLILFIGSIYSTVLLIRKNVEKAIISLALGLICTLTVGAFYLPQVNKYIGYKDIAASAKEYEKFAETVKYSSYKSRLIQNMDVYLNHAVSRINTPMEIDSLNQLEYPTILFVANREITKDEELKKCLLKYTCGRKDSEYSWFLIGSELGYMEKVTNDSR